MSTEPWMIYRRIHGNPAEGRLPLVFLHGLLGFSANWGKIWPFFEPSRACLVLDQRGHGKSFHPPNGYSPSDYAEDLRQILDELGWKKIHLVGHSMGGRVAMQFAQDHAEHVESLVLEDSGAEARPDRLAWIQGLLGGIPTPFPDRESANRFFQEKYTHDTLLGGFLHANLRAREDGAYDWRFFPPGMIETIASGRAKDAMEVFRGLKQPTLLIRGGKSEEFRSEEAARMQKSREGVQLETIPEAGHFVHAQMPQAFNDILAGWLRGRD